MFTHQIRHSQCRPGVKKKVYLNCNHWLHISLLWWQESPISLLWYLNISRWQDWKKIYLDDRTHLSARIVIASAVRKRGTGGDASTNLGLKLIFAFFIQQYAESGPKMDSSLVMRRLSLSVEEFQFLKMKTHLLAWEDDLHLAWKQIHSLPGLWLKLDSWL